MLKINILTLFPEMFNGFLSESIIKRAIEDKKVKIEIINLRDYSDMKHNQVDLLNEVEKHDRELQLLLIN